MNEKKREYAIIRCLGASRLVIYLVVLAQSLFLSLAGLLGAFLAYWGIGFTAARLIREKTGVCGFFVLSLIPSAERTAILMGSGRRGGVMKPCGPWSNPFSSFGFSAWNFSNRIRKWLDSRSSGISFKPVRQLEP